MIVINGLSKTYYSDGAKRQVIRDLNARLPTDGSVALLGRNGAGKSSLLRMIAGTSRPTKGSIKSTGSISWPVGFSGSFNGDLTGAQNVKFVARIYGIRTDELSDFVEKFAELGAQYHMPFRTYSSGMRSRLAFGVSMGIQFDTYLIDEVTSVGDAGFREKSENFLKERLKSSGAIVVSHSLDLLKKLCTTSAVLENSCLTMFDSVEEGIERHLANLKPKEQANV